MDTISFKSHRFTPEIIRRAVWLYARFALSYRDVEDLLAERGLDISYESVRRWFLKFGAPIARNLRHTRPIPNGYWHLDEMIIVIRGRRYWLWRGGALSRPRPVPATAVNHVWAYDFVFDTCANGQTLKCLTVVDEWTRESLAIDVAGGIRSGRVIEVLTQLVSVHGAPRYLRSDNGPEFVAGAILRWLLQAQIETALIEPGKPWQNATDESFNAKFRDEYLSLQWFRNRVDAKVGIEQWRRHYNDVRPHSSLGYLTPAEFKAQLRAGSDDGGRSPAMPAHADQEEHESDLTLPTGAVLQ